MDPIAPSSPNSILDPTLQPRDKPTAMAAPAPALPAVTPHATFQTGGDEGGQLGLLRVVVPYTDTRRTRNVLQVFVLDRSGSMAGWPWQRVKEAVSYISAQVAKSRPGTAVTVRLVAYNHTAEECTPEQVLSMSAGGSTNFCRAFEAVQRVLEGASHVDYAPITFMTDGEDTASRANAVAEKQSQLGAFLKQLPFPTVVHTIGFGADHNLAFLEQLKNIGSEGGCYRYSARDYTDLEDTFAQVFHFASAAGQALQVTLDTGKGPLTVEAHVSKDEAVIEQWVEAGAVEDFVQVSLFGEPIQVSLFGEPIAVEVQPADVYYEVKCLERHVEALQAKVSAGDTGADPFEGLDQLQAKLSEVNAFRAPRAQRQAALETRASVQAQLDVLHKARAQGARSSASAAVNADLRFAAVFSKARRQRAMDVRTAKNAAAASGLEERVQALASQLSDSDFDDVSLEDFRCDVSHQNVRECMEEGGVLGLGVCIRERAEHIVDAPTNIQIDTFSVTICSKQTFEYAVRYKVPIQGAANVLGQFLTRGSGQQQARGSMSGPSALVGRAREPINAWIPLYICKAHFAMVRVQLRPILGYLFTLDPLGYEGNQVVGLFTILGHMRAHMHVAHSEGLARDPEHEAHRKWLLLQDFTRFCHAMLPTAREFLGCDLVKRFVASAAGRTRAALQNLMTVVGWAAAAAGTSATSAASSVDGRDAFGMLLYEEAMRRKLAQHYHGSPKAAVWEQIKRLLYGEGLGALSSKESDTATDPTLGKSLTRLINKKVDKAFASYARYKAGAIKKEHACPAFESVADEIRLKAEEPVKLDVGNSDDVVVDTMNDLLSYGRDSYLGAAIKLPNLEGLENFVHLKAVLVNCLMHYTNGLANDGAAAGAFKSVHEAGPTAVLEAAHSELEQQRKLQTEAAIRSAEALRVARLVVYTEDLWSFCGRLMVACPTRGGDTWDHLVELLQRPPAKIPLHEQKVRIVALGRYILPATDGGDDTEYSIIANGCAWRIPQAVSQRFEAAIGKEAMEALRLQILGRVARHIYRGWPGDIPNRHNHCNSNPSDWALGIT